MTTSLDFLRPPAIPGIASSGTTTKAIPPPKVPKPVDPSSLFSISGTGTPIPNSSMPAAPSIRVPTDPYALGPDITGNGPGVMLRTPASSSPAIPQVKAPSASGVALPSISGGSIFKSGLNPAQISGLQALQSKPAASWTDTDRKNWAYGTNNAPVPGAQKPAMPNIAPSTTPAAAPTAPGTPNAPDAGTSTPQPGDMGNTGGASTPATPSLGEAAVKLAQDAYQKAMQLSPDELSTQADIDRLVESTKKAYTNTEGQAIPMGFITGQLSAIERRATDLAEPLDRKLARLQAARQSALDASKFALDRADKAYADEQASAKEKAKITEVGGNLVRLNSATGKYETVYEAPGKAAEGFTLGEGQQRYDASGKLIASGAEKARDVRESGGYLWERQPNGTWGVVGGNGPTDGGGKVVNVNGTDYIRNSDGTFSLPNIPESAASNEKLDALRGKVTLIDSLLSSKGMAGSVGPYGIARWTPFTADKAERAEFAAGVNQLIGQETIDTLVSLKERGGTLGALSDQERVLLQTAASKIGSWIVRDKSGNPTGEFEVSEKDFKAELNRIKDLTNKAIERAGGSGGTDDLDAALQSAGIPGFNSVPSMTKNGSAETIAAAIKHVESGGNYSARGGSGESGAYQFMPATWRQWAGQYLGNQNAPMTRANQDKVAVSHISSLLAKGYNPVQVALIWNGGKPVVKRGVNQYGVAYDSGAYARKVVGALKNLA